MMGFIYDNVRQIRRHVAVHPVGVEICVYFLAESQFDVPINTVNIDALVELFEAD